MPCRGAGGWPDLTPEDALYETEAELKATRRKQPASAERIKRLEETAKLQKQLVTVWRQLKAARKEQDRQRARELEPRVEELQELVERRQHINELAFELSELRGYHDEASASCRSDWRN